MGQRIDGNKITLTRGDTFRARFILAFDDVDYELQDGDEVRFAINTPDHEDIPLVEKVLDGYDLTLDPEDTKDLDFDTYNYDVQITFAESGDTLTYIPEDPKKKAKFILTWEAD